MSIKKLVGFGPSYFKMNSYNTHFDHLCSCFLQIYVLKKEEGGRERPIVQNYQPHLFSYTWDCGGRVTLADKEMLMPGEDGKINVKLFKPMVLERGQRFTIRDGTKTSGTGVVTNVHNNLTNEEREVLFKKTDKNREKVREEKLKKRQGLA